MRHLFSTAAVPEDQLSRALDRVHARLRRRRRRIHGAGAAVMACIVLVVAGVATQTNSVETPVDFDAMESGGPPSVAMSPEETEMCRHALAHAGAVELDLTIRGPVEWPAPSIGLWPSPQVIVVARNQSSRPLDISTSPSVVGLTAEGFVDTEPSAPVSWPTTVTLGPSEEIELAAGLPQHTCSGNPLEAGRYTLVPLLQIEDFGDRPIVVRGDSVSVSHR